MIINRQHWGWAAFVIVASILAVLLYLGEFHRDRVTIPLRLPESLHRDVKETGRSVGGTPLGITYGSVSAAIFVFAALYGLRRKRPTLRLGRLQTWLKGHLWLTLLTVPLILLHCGFSLGSPMTAMLVVVYAVVMISGVYGLVLQHFLPRLMKERVPLETIFEQIPHVRKQLEDLAIDLRKSLEPALVPTIAAVESLTAAGSTVTITEPATSIVVEAAPDSSIEVMKRFLDEAGFPYLSAKRGDKLLLGNQRVSDEQFRLLKVSVGADWQPKVEQLQAWCDERRQLDLQTKFQHWLHAWLLVHVPVSVLLLIFTAWHAMAALYFY
ncbi:MAG TPA: hypothetical protein VK530_00235 [Candidatus Acidoferrum sp.]|nr:hypothetical protein [Candidatus Acidoferrum sp.]